MGKKTKAPDIRAIEKTTSDISRLMEGKDFKSLAEAQEFLSSILVNGQIAGSPPKSAVEFAQDIMYEAWDAESRKKRIELAKEALAASPDCADAYNLLAEEEATTLEEMKDLYQKGMEAGRRALGEKMFIDKDAHFWGYTPSRPYMRSRAGLMDCLWGLEEHDEAINHAREMLKLNTNDNQGIRYVLVAYLAGLGRYDELDELLNKSANKNDPMVDWLYTRALLSFVKKGDSDKAKSDLKKALASNQYVPEYLTGKKRIPRSLPDSIIVEGEDEGFCYAAAFLDAWKMVPGAIDWLKVNEDL